MNNGKVDEAQKMFQQIINEFPFAQAWDPSRGSFWSVAEKSQASIDMLTGKAEQMEEEKRKSEPSNRIDLKIYTKGKSDVIDYSKYGKFLTISHFNINQPSLNEIGNRLPKGRKQILFLPLGSGRQNNYCFSKIAFRLSSPFCRSGPTILSMSMNKHIKFIG